MPENEDYSQLVNDNVENIEKDFKFCQKIQMDKKIHY